MSHFPKLPTQPLYYDRHGTTRFRENALVRFLLDEAREGRQCDLNRLAEMEFPREDRVQFAQLIGYSLSGFGELSYVSNVAYARAEREGKVPVRGKKRKP